MSVAKPKLAYSIAEAAAACGVSRDTINREIRDGRLIKVYLRAQPVIPAEALDAYIENASSEPRRVS